MSSWLQILDPRALGDSEDALERVVLSAGEILFRQGDPGRGMYVVVAGCLQVLGVRDDGSETILGELRRGDTIGEVQILTGGERTATIRAAEASELLELSPEVFNRIVERSPALLDEMVARTRRRLNRSLLASVLPDLFGPLDRQTLEYLESEESQAEWIFIRRGEKLFEQGDVGDDLYVVLSGRLAAVVTGDGGQEQVLGEIARGEMLGEMALFTGEPRTSAVRALRDSLLVGFSKQSFEKITRRLPGVLFNVSRVLVRRLAESRRSLAAGSPAAGRVRTVAVVPADGGVPAGELARRLTAALSSFGSTQHLSRERLESLCGLRRAAGAAEDDVARRRLAEWLDSQEAHFRFLVYEAEPRPSAWTRKCLRQADRILVVTEAGAVPDADLVPRLASGSSDGGSEASGDLVDRGTLVILHPDGRRPPHGTARPLAALGLSRHHHLRWDEAGDCERLARFLDGRAVGLALGGGGARGFAQIGVIRALLEAGVPIDMVGGTSMGALMAAQFAASGDPEVMVEMNRRAFLVGKPQRDYTLPLLGVLSGRRPERLLHEMFQEVEFEDLWLNCFAVSSNLTTARQVVHRRGPVVRAIRASCSVPGAVTPVLEGDELLVDGGVLNNLPGDVMRRLCGGRVVLVDVSPASDLTITGVGERLPSPWKVLWSRVNPFIDRIAVPNLIEVVMRASTLASVQNAEQAKAAADLYLAPPVARFGMFDLTALETLVDIGYLHAKREIERWGGRKEL